MRIPFSLSRLETPSVSELICQSRWSAEEAFRVAAERSAAYEDRAEGGRVWEIPPFEGWGS